MSVEERKKFFFSKPQSGSKGSKGSKSSKGSKGKKGGAGGSFTENNNGLTNSEGGGATGGNMIGSENEGLTEATKVGGEY